VPDGGPDAATVVARCREQGLFLRDATGMGTQLGRHALRIAVKDRDTNRRMAEILRAVCGFPRPRDSARSANAPSHREIQSGRWKVKFPQTS